MILETLKSIKLALYEFGRLVAKTKWVEQPGKQSN